MTGRTRALLLAAAAGLGACRGEQDVGLPAGCERVPGNALAVALGPGIDRLPALDALLVQSGIEVRRDVPGFVHAVAPELRTGWASLSGSRPFAAAWSARPGPGTAPDAWVFVDLQALVDHLLADVDPRARELARPLGLSALEWAIAAVRQPEGGPAEVDGLVQSSPADVGIVAMLGAPPSPSLLAPRPGGERLRLELRTDADVAHRSLEAWVAESEGAGGLSVRNAVFDAIRSVGRRLLVLVDGRATVVVDAEGRVFAAAGLRAPDDARDELDALLRSVDEDEWLAPGGLLAAVDGDRLVLAPVGLPLPEAGTRVVDAAVIAEFAVDGGLRGRVEVRRRDVDTLELRARVD